MNVVDFAEGILGGRQQSKRIAKCLRQVALDEQFETQLRMVDVADDLELGHRIEVERLRKIGEKPLADTQRLFLDAKKENSN